MLLVKGIPQKKDCSGDSVTGRPWPVDPGRLTDEGSEADDWRDDGQSGGCRPSVADVRQAEARLRQAATAGHRGGRGERAVGGVCPHDRRVPANHFSRSLVALQPMSSRHFSRSADI
jgi:hypothetical protein